MKKLRIGVVGLGGIAQKAWLPVLAAASDWTLQGARSPTRAKALPICDSWRIPYADSLSSLAASCDAVFVHSSTASHFGVVSTLLNAGYMSVSINRWQKICAMLNGWWNWRRGKTDVDGRF